MIQLVRNAHDTSEPCMIDLVTVVRDRVYMWGSFHEDMLHSRNTEQATVDGINTAYEDLQEVDVVECVLLTRAEFDAMVKVPE